MMTTESRSGYLTLLSSPRSSLALGTMFGWWPISLPLLAMMTEDLSTRVWDTDLSCVVNFGTPAGEVREKDPVL